MRFAAATAASLLFPFAPHTAADVYELLTGERVWEQPWPAADPAFLERDTFELVVPGQRQGARPRRGAGRRVRATSSRRWRCAAPNVAGPRRRQEVVKVIVVPGKLVNFVVR